MVRDPIPFVGGIYCRRPDYFPKAAVAVTRTYTLVGRQIAANGTVTRARALRDTIGTLWTGRGDLCFVRARNRKSVNVNRRRRDRRGAVTLKTIIYRSPTGNVSIFHRGHDLSCARTRIRFVSGPPNAKSGSITISAFASSFRFRGF